MPGACQTIPGWKAVSYATESMVETSLEVSLRDADQLTFPRAGPGTQLYFFVRDFPGSHRRWWFVGSETYGGIGACIEQFQGCLHGP